MTTRAEQDRHSDARASLVRSAGVASVAVALTLVALKTWAWLATDSVAMLGSLADSCLDLLASTMILIAVRFAHEPADREHRFGHGKLEAIAGLLQSLVILGSAAYVAIEAIKRLAAPVPVEAPFAGVLVMLISLALTILLVSYQRHVVRRTRSIAISADALHYKADILMNGTVLVAILASSGLGLHRADPILGFVVVIVILGSIRAIVLQSLDVLLDRELPGDRRAEIFAIAKQHEAVLGVHDLRTRTSGTHEFIQFHLELRPEIRLARAHEICDEVEDAVKREFPHAEILIHADPYGVSETKDVF